VGDIQDEYDTEEPGVQPIGEGVALVDARLLIDDVNEQFDLRLMSDESDRIGGLMFEHLGRLPLVGDRVELPGDVTITVVSVEGFRPRQLRLTFPTDSEADDLSMGDEDRTERRSAVLRSRQRGEAAP
jgi:CBS domain containing-hemolysin-like protein